MAHVPPWQSCLWATYIRPHTLVSIGMEALAALHDHTIQFTDLKTKNKLYYTIDHPAVGLGARNIAGHFSLPMFAYSETVIRPNIHIVRYPDMHKLFVLQSKNVVSYLDIMFSNYDLLIALSGFPNYTFRIWNCRTGNLLVETETGIKCSPYSLQCSSRTWPMIMQYSKFQKQIIIWEINYTAEATKLHEISRVQLQKAHSLSTRFSMCFLDDVVYVVNDFGVVYSVEVAQFYLLRQWGTTFADHGLPQPYCLYPHKHGLMVVSEKSFTYISRKRNLWVVEWVMTDLEVTIGKMILNFAGEVYAADNVGSLYQLHVDHFVGTLNKFSASNYMVEEFTTLRGLKEENLLILTCDKMVYAVDVSRSIKYSELHIPQGCCIAAHNSMPFAAVGTEDGQLYFISFEKIQTPVIMHVMKVDKFRITGIRLMNQTGLIKNMHNAYKELLVDFKLERFILLIPLLSRPDIRVLNFFLIETDFALSFLSENEEGNNALIPYADEMWVSAWIHAKRVVNRRVFMMPKKYRSITLLQVLNKDNVEFIGLPMDSFEIDLYAVKNVEKVYLMRTLHTFHMGYISGVTGTRHITTYGISTLMIHFRSHKRSPKPYAICRKLYSSYAQRMIRHVEEIYNSKYLVVLLDSGCLKISRLYTLSDNLRENIEILDEPIELELLKMNVTPCMVTIAKKSITPESRALRTAIDRRIAELEIEVRDLIDYDISVTGKQHGIYRKFCLNYSWLNQLNVEARKVCEIERQSLVESIADKSRIRDWIRNLITGETAKISIKLRAIFSDNLFENYSLSKALKELAEFFDLYQFQDLEAFEEEEDQEANEPQKDAKDAGEVVGGTDVEEEGIVKDVAVVKKKRKLYQILGNVYDHIMAEDFQMQDIHLVTANQMYNEDIKFKVLLDGPLREEFNKIFDEIHQYKQEIMTNILGTNASLNHIYADMNIMLQLLGLKTFTPEKLSVPMLMNDEVLERIMTVSDSEIKAINRHAKKAVVSDQRHGRMLLWSFDFWIRALNTMMDGVLEKLWEEEIKKTPPEPEFMSKRQPHEYTLEDQKLLRIYEETLRLLMEDRQKYLRILNVNERKTIELKNNYIYKFNERCAQVALLKLKYDFALKHFRVRLLGLKVNFYQRDSLRKSLSDLGDETDKANEYINRYVKLIELSDKSIADIKQDMEFLNSRDKSLERQFKGNFLVNIPTFTHELNKLFRRRPKMLQRSFQSALVCHEVAARLMHKSRSMFPLPVEVQEYFNNLITLDDPQNAPNQLDAKYWEQFVRLRRQKIENELKVKGQGFHLADSQDKLNNYITELNNLRNIKHQMIAETDRLSGMYFNIVQNQHLELVLPLGQVETTIGGSLKNLQNCILMNIDDINAVNDLIKKAGAKKLRTMQRLAVFRRQVLYKEWEHKMFRANIDYLKYMLEVIEKCKVTAEFLQLLRNWKKVKEERTKLMRVGGIEQLIEQRVAAYRKNLDRVNEKIAICKDQIVEVKRKNQTINRAIDEVKVDVAIFTANRDTLLEEKLQRERNESMEKIKRYSFLINEVRQDYAHILELKTILELQRLRTFPTLGPPPEDCGNPMT